MNTSFQTVTAREPTLFVTKAPPRPAPFQRPVRLCIFEEQEILRSAFESFCSADARFELASVSGETSTETLAGGVAKYQPDVLVIGTKVLHTATVEQLHMIRDAAPKTCYVVLSAAYDLDGIKAFREFIRVAKCGCAFLLKHGINTVDDLTKVILSVSEGRIILDPTVMERLISAGESTSTFLKELSPREMEVLSWIAKGYRNNTIAEVLCLEPKTIERHINSIYAKLGELPESKHARVHAAMLYLKAVGQLADDGTDK